MGKSQLVDWEFEQINLTDYQCSMMVLVKHKMMQYIFVKTKDRLRKTKGVRVTTDLENVSRIDIPKDYFKLLRTSISQVTKQIIVDVRRDDIIVQSIEVLEAYFLRAADDWMVYIMVGGTFFKK